MIKLLLIEDNAGLREQMKWALADEYEVFEAETLDTAVATYKSHMTQVVCLDMGLENNPERGLEVLDALLRIDRQAKIIVITSNTSETLGPRAVELGAFDYLNKPVEIEELKVILARASRILQLESASSEPQEIGLVSDSEFLMLGSSDAILQIFNHIRRLAKTEVSVLITGESGTGKELCARAVHYHSQRRNQAFVPINCGAIPESLMESELFGYMKGAFTGANADKMGLLESADKGTVFLDEIGDMPKSLQVKLLRFLEDQKLQRLGDTRLRSVNVRIIAATNKNNLADENNEVMRTDLYYRLSEFEIRLPPLRERGNDILLIARKVAEKNRKKFDMPKLKLSLRAEQMIAAYTWPGNVRELENRLNRASITCMNQTIEPDDLQISDNSYASLNLKEAKGLFEKNFLVNSLKQAKGNISLAAKNIGVTRPTFYDLIKKYDLEA